MADAPQSRSRRPPKPSKWKKTASESFGKLFRRPTGGLSEQETGEGGSGAASVHGSQEQPPEQPAGAEPMEVELPQQPAPVFRAPYTQPVGYRL